MKKLRRKLNSKRGESIAEVLVALLISSLGLALLAVMIASSVRMIETGRETVAEYVEAENALVTRDAASGLSGTAVLNAGGYDLKLTDASSVKTPVVYYVNGAIGGTSVIAYRKGD